jgi:hypothetical protein
VIPEFAFVLHDAEVKKLSLGFDIHIWHIATRGAGTAYPSGAPEFTIGF